MVKHCSKVSVSRRTSCFSQHFAPFAADWRRRCPLQVSVPRAGSRKCDLLLLLAVESGVRSGVHCGTFRCQSEERPSRQTGGLSQETPAFQRDRVLEGVASGAGGPGWSCGRCAGSLACGSKSRRPDEDEERCHRPVAFFIPHRCADRPKPDLGGASDRSHEQPAIAS